MAESRTDEIRREIQSTRKRRLFEFRERYGSDAEAAAKLGVKPNFFSQFKLHESKKKGRRSIGEVLARRMEEEAGLPKLWFDDIVTTDQQFSYRELEIMNAFRRLTPDAQKHLEGLLPHLPRKGPQDDPDPEAHIDTQRLRALHDKTG